MSAEHSFRNREATGSSPVLRAMTFTITPSMREKVTAWFEMHACKAQPDCTNALLSYRFMPCGIGDTVTAICACGQELDLTEIDTW